MTEAPKPGTVEGILAALETETAKLDSLQSLCGVVAETTSIVSEAALTGTLFGIMNNVEAVKDRLSGIVHQVMELQRSGGRP